MVDQDAPIGPDTRTGEDVGVNVLIPSCPEALRPHPYNWPVVVIPRECEAPAAIADHEAPAGPETRTGEETVAVDKLPTAPAGLAPQPHNVPSDLIASVAPADPATCFQDCTAAGPTIATGDETFASELIPTCPEVFCPQP